jgi:hypothetical protein
MHVSLRGFGLAEIILLRVDKSGAYSRRRLLVASAFAMSP